MLNKRGRLLSVSVLIFLILFTVAYADTAINSGDASKCSIKNFPKLFKYDENKNKNLATALYSISISFKEQNVEMTPKLLAAVMATLEKEVEVENFLPVEENGDYGQGENCAYKISGKCRKKSYDGGVDYKGRGYIQITHKENYAKYCGQECVGNSAPELDVCGCKNKKHCTQTDESVCPQLKALHPEYAGRIFASYYLGTKYKNSSLVQLAEKDGYRTIGEKINGGQGYADDFAKKAGNYLQLFEPGEKTSQLLDCLDISTEGYCSENSNCEPGKECNLSAHTCQYKQTTIVPSPTGCPNAYLFSCNDPISSAIKRFTPALFKIIVHECSTGYIYGNDRRCHTECGTGGKYCAGDSQCFNGNCFDCDPGYHLETDGFCYPEPATACDSGYILGEDGFCHPECGNSGTYCIGNSQCYNGQCMGCDPGYYLATDGLCYPENGGEDTVCPEDTIYGEDNYCHPECGNSRTYCIGDSLCYMGQCLACDPGYYLATDGLCYPENGNENAVCPDSTIYGEDNLCHTECGNSGTYCIGDSQCFNNQCLACDAGYYLATDGQCYPDYTCEAGFILGEDILCHPECGNSGTYCIGDSQCYNGQCLTCDQGYYLATDGKCYPENGGGDCDPGYYLAEDGLCYPDTSCDFGYILGEDGLCHKECGISGTYCIGDSQCYFGKCLECDSGYYLGTDGKCYPENGGGSCDSGYILGNDDLCHRECGNSGTYCTGSSQCYNGQCLTCDQGYYLGTDGKCYSENGGGSSCDPGYILGNDDLCHRECGNSGTYCIGSSICYNGQCLTCDAGYYLATDGRCYPY